MKVRPTGMRPHVLRRADELIDDSKAWNSGFDPERLVTLVVFDRGKREIDQGKGPISEWSPIRTLWATIQEASQMVGPRPILPMAAQNMPKDPKLRELITMREPHPVVVPVDPVARKTDYANAIAEMPGRYDLFSADTIQVRYVGVSSVVLDVARELIQKPARRTAAYPGITHN